MKQYKPLLSSAPANSILNAQQFHYRNSANTDIRKTFANFRCNGGERREERLDIDEESDRRDAGVFFACVAATIHGLIDSLQDYAKEQRKMNMLTRFIQRLGLWMTACLLAAAVTGSVVMAEAPARADEGRVEAIEISIARPTASPSTPER